MRERAIAGTENGVKSMTVFLILCDSCVSLLPLCYLSYSVTCRILLTPYVPFAQQGEYGHVTNDQTRPTHLGEDVKTVLPKAGEDPQYLETGALCQGQGVCGGASE